MKYKVSFSGFAYVEADSSEEAEDMFLNDNVQLQYSETGVDAVEEVDDFLVEL